MSVVQGLLEEEMKRLESGIALFKDELNKLPKGCLSIRKLGGFSFVYRIQRINGKIEQEYIGKADSNEANEAIKLREKYIRLKRNISDAEHDLIALRKAVKSYERKSKPRWDSKNS